MGSHDDQDMKEETNLSTEICESKENDIKKPARIWDTIDVDNDKKNGWGHNDKNNNALKDRTNEDAAYCSSIKNKIKALVKQNSDTELKVRELKTVLGRKKLSKERKLKKLEMEWKKRMEEQQQKLEKVCPGWNLAYYIYVLPQQVLFYCQY